MPIEFKAFCSDCRISLHWINFSVIVPPDALALAKGGREHSMWRPEWDKYFPTYRVGGETKTHFRSYYYDIDGMIRRDLARPKVHNYDIELEIPGSFFDEGNSLDDFFSAVYSVGGSIKISRLDVALDHFGDISEFRPIIDSKQHQLMKLYAPHHDYSGKWTGFHVGSQGSNRKWTVYDRVEKYGIYADSHFYGRLNWWRCELKIQKKYAWKLFPEGKYYENDLERIGAIALTDTSTVDCGIFPEMAKKVVTGEIVLRQRAQVTFESAREKLMVDLVSRFRKFRRIHGLNDGSDLSEYLISDIEKRVIQALRNDSLSSKASKPYRGSSDGIAIPPVAG